MPIVQRTNETVVKGVADVVFVFDVTGSMQPYIDKVKDNVRALVDGFKAYPQINLDWRVRAMGYRDITCDSEAIINKFPFVTNEAAFAEQLGALRADGGGDADESALDAIWYAIRKSDWRPGKLQKVIVLFTDAGTKGLHPSTMDELGIADDMTYLQTELTKGKYQFFLFGPEHPTYEELRKAERTHIELYSDTNNLLTTDFAELLKLIGKTVSQSSVTAASKTL